MEFIMTNKLSESEDKVVVQKRNEADVLWDEIKDLSIEVFALPNQKVGNYLKRLNNPSALFVRASATAVLPALEAALGDSYSVEVTETCWIIKRSNKVDVSKLLADE
jgi:LysM repeat protein